MQRTILKRVPKKTDPKAQKEFMSKWASAVSSKYERCKDIQSRSAETCGEREREKG